MLDIRTEELRARLSIEAKRGSGIRQVVIRSREAMGVAVFRRSVSRLANWFTKSEEVRTGAYLYNFRGLPTERRGAWDLSILIIIIQPTTVLLTHNLFDLITFLFFCNFKRSSPFTRLNKCFGALRITEALLPPRTLTFKSLTSFKSFSRYRRKSFVRCFRNKLVFSSIHGNASEGWFGLKTVAQLGRLAAWRWVHALVLCFS